MLRKLTLAQRISLAVALCLGVGGSAVGVLIYQLKSTSNTYEVTLKALQESAREQDAARVVQVTFKKQVQEWKDTLLRGYNPDDLAKYSTQFHQQAARVSELSAALQTSLSDPAARRPVEDFNQAFGAMREKYDSALKIFVKAKGANARDVDKLVKGQDRAATDLLMVGRKGVTDGRLLRPRRMARPTKVSHQAVPLKDEFAEMAS